MDTDDGENSDTGSSLASDGLKQLMAKMMNSSSGQMKKKSGSTNRDVVETQSQFSNMSLTSSVIRRNEQLRLLDERFDKVRVETYFIA